MAKGLRESGNDVQTDIFFDTLKVSPRLDITEIKHRANEMKINFRYFPDESVGISLGETIERKDVRDILWVFGTPKVTLLWLGQIIQYRFFIRGRSSSSAKILIFFSESQSNC